MLKSVSSLKRRSIFDRSSTLITMNDNNIEKINLEDYTMEFKIGKANSGYIYICKNIKTNKLYFMKILKKAKLLQNKNSEHITNEYLILSSTFHPFIIDLKGINNTNPITLNFVYEYVPGGNLNTLLKTQKRLSIDSSRFYLASIITALDYLHKKNIIYRYLMPQNILIMKNGYIKLSEFGLSKKMENEMTFTMCGSPEYYSPEMINKTGHNKSIDFWQLGILLYEMLLGYPPFIDSDPIQLYKKINKGKINFPKDFNKYAKNIIKQFLKVDMNKRLGCTKRGIYEIILHPFYKDFNWEDLLHRKLKPPIIPKMPKISIKSNNYNLYEDFNEMVSKENDPFYNWS